jgi:hypothetical protein
LNFLIIMVVTASISFSQRGFYCDVGEVNVSLSTIQKFSLRAPKMIENEMAVQLVDSFFNPVLSQQSRLTLEIASVNKSGFSSGMFVDNDNGTYCIRYVVKDGGTYEMCVSFDGKRLSPCPFGVNVYGGKLHSSPPL